MSAEEYVPQEGDHVRMVVEGVVTAVSTDGRVFDIGESGGFYHRTAPEILSVEKIEPPVEVFKPGDLLRSKDSACYWYLAPNGYVRLVAGDFTNATDFFEYDGEEWTSKQYERVELK